MASPDRPLRMQRLGGFVVLVVMSLASLARAQDPAKPEPEQPAIAEPIAISTNRKDAQRLEAAQEYLKESAWGEATRILQAILDQKEVSWLRQQRKDADGKERVLFVSARQEAQRLLATLPAAGKQFYETQYGPLARKLLDQGKKQKDLDVLRDAVQHYLQTTAGSEALYALAEQHLADKQFHQAALCYQQLMAKEGINSLTSETLYQAAIAFRRAGEKGGAEQALKLRAKTAKDGLRLGMRTLTLEELEKDIDKVAPLPSAADRNWPVYRGDPSRSGESVGGAPFLEPRWTVSTLPAADRPENRTASGWIEENLKLSQSYLDQRQQVALPASFPITADRKLIFRAFDGIYAVSLGKGEVQWFSPADHGLHVMIRDAGKRMQLDQWWTGTNYGFGYMINGPYGILIENSLIGSLSTDNSKAYAIDDLAVPPPMQLMQQFQMDGKPQFGELTDMVYHNRLKALEVDSGKIAWELGGRGGNDPFADTFFLGAPLPLGGMLYFLVEKNGELQLVCLEPPRQANARPQVSWRQTLAKPRDPLPLDSSRRIHAVHLAHGDGILVCPTNAGAVFGIDLLTRQLAWAVPYREEVVQPVPPKPPIRPRPVVAMTASAGWKVAAPAIQDGKVIFTAPDAASLHCLNLRDGELLWKIKREADDLYLAGVFNNRALIVSKDAIRAHNLADGKLLWRLQTGQPSGQGIASEEVYYLPLKAGTGSKEPEVCAIDMKKGQILARTRSRRKQVSGNLIFYQGDVISQTGTTLTAYPQLSVKLGEIDQRLKQNPKDPTGLTEQGELLLHKGDVLAAIMALDTARKNQPPAELLPRLRGLLLEAVTELLQRDFEKGEKYLDLARDLGEVDIPRDATPEQVKALQEEVYRRKGNFLVLLARGREKQGRLVDAFDAYMDFGSLAGHRELVSVIDEPTTRARPDVWARGRILAMIQQAKPEARKPLEAKIEQKWKEIQKGNDLGALRNFVALFGSLFKAGREARLHFAEQLLAVGKEDELREAQLHLLQLRSQKDDAESAGRAVEALARLMMKKGLLDHAAHYYVELGRDFGKVTIRDGKTGEDLFNSMATDKRFMPYLEEPRPSWNGILKGMEVPGNFPQQRQLFRFDAEGELLPFFQRHRMVLDMNNLQFQVIERATGQERWTSPRLVPAYYLQSYPNARFSYRVKGHLAVVQLSHMVYGFDPVDKKKLWEYNLFGTGINPAALQIRQITQDPRDGSLILMYQDGWTQRVSQPGPIEASYVCLQTRDGLVALDPVRGSVLWTRSGVPASATIFGDDQHIYIVETEADGTPKSTRAIRAADGTAVTVPDFKELFARRLRVVGGTLLVEEKEAKSLSLRLYDVHTGKDTWKKTFAGDSIVMKSEQPGLAGVVEPSGAVTIFDLQSGKETLKTGVNREHATMLQHAYVLQDADQYYLLLNKPTDPIRNPEGGPFPNVMQGMRSILANGMVYTYNRKTGKANWWRDVTQQMLVLDQFDDLPILLFTSRYSKPINQGGGRILQFVAVSAIDKKAGKLVWDKDNLGQNYQQFYALNTDPKAGTIELVGYNLKMRFYLKPREK